MCFVVYALHERAADALQLLMGLWQSNPHGGGFLVKTQQGWIVRKGLMSKASFARAWKRYVDIGLEFVGHIRYATLGGIVPELTHPFPCGPDRWLFHNGVCDHLFEDIREGESDSAALARLCIPMPTERILAHLERLSERGGGRFILAAEGCIHTVGDWHSYRGMVVSRAL
ncbi:MAG: hypothetical protein NZ552_01080 [Planctomycetes bacterium]|nr:hypothetical protein [Planctomycetota bacterium]